MSTSSSPFRGGTAVTPNDSTDLPTDNHRALWIGTGGTLKVDVASVSASGTGRNTVTTTVGDGSIFPFRVLRVWTTGTTASGIVAGW